MIIAITGKIASGKSFISNLICEKLSEKHDCELIDLDQFCKKQLLSPAQITWLESEFDVPIPYASKTEFSNFIFEHVFSRLDYYAKWCSFYERSLECKLSALAADKSGVINFVEASALYSYPSLLKYCDHIVEVQAEKSDRLDAYAKRSGLQKAVCLSRMRVLDKMFEHMKGRAKAIHSKTPVVIVHNTFHDFGANIDSVCSSLEHWLMVPAVRRVESPAAVPGGGRLNTVALFCGSFNPFTLGHKSIYDKAKKLFDTVLVVRAQNPGKPSPEFECSIADFTTDYVPSVIERVGLMFPEHEVVLVRGILNATDYEEAERWHNSIELCLGERIELVLLKANPLMVNMSSSFVRALYKLDKSRAENFFIN